MKTTLFITIIISVFYLNTHKCSWQECPAKENFEKYSDSWCIQQTHIEQPEKSYEECEYILFADGKDTNIN